LDIHIHARVCIMHAFCTLKTDAWVYSSNSVLSHGVGNDTSESRAVIISNTNYFLLLRNARHREHKSADGFERYRVPKRDHVGLCKVSGLIRLKVCAKIIFSVAVS
jgi:hypothetical protein